MTKDRGLWNYVQSIHSAILTFTAVGFFVYKAINSDNHYRPIALKMLGASMINIVGLILTLISFGSYNLNYIVLSLPITMIVVIRLMIKDDFLEIGSLAKDAVLENSHMGIVLVNTNGEIIDINPST